MVLGLSYSFMVRFNLYYPLLNLESDQLYNASFTSHGLIMVFFYLVPMVFSASGNWSFSWLLGLPDLVHPRMNLLSFHAFVASLLPYVLHCFSRLLETAWTFYPPLSTYRTGNSLELVVLSLHLNGLSRILGSYNFIATYLYVGVQRYDLVVYRILTASLLLLVGLPAVVVCLSMVLMDRKLSTSFFGNIEGGEVLVYLHLFW